MSETTQKNEAKITRRSRKYQLTFNNPKEHGDSHESIKKRLSSWSNINYYCLCDERGSTFHTHLYIVFQNPVRFTSIKKTFPTAHIEEAKGSARENRDYIKKEGRWENSEKETTNLKETFEEWGTLPEGQGHRSDLAELYQMVKDGYTNTEILEHNSDYILHLNHIDRARLEILMEKYRKERRLDLEVIYVYGKTGAGKTRSILDLHGDANVYRVTDYSHPFDNYRCEDVLVLEEYRSDFTIGNILNYLDIYPCTLPARYNNRVAAYHYVYILSNYRLEDQYPMIQKEQPETWKAFLRRIHKVRVYTDAGTFAEYATEEYLHGFHKIPETESIPFNAD